MLENNSINKNVSILLPNPNIFIKQALTLRMLDTGGMRFSAFGAY